MLPSRTSTLLLSQRPLLRRFSTEVLHVDNPYSLKVVHSQQLENLANVKDKAARCKSAQQEWAKVPVEERVEVCKRVVDYFQQNQEQIARDISNQMGKPLAQAKGEIGGLAERGLRLADLAPKAIGGRTMQTSSGDLELTTDVEPLGLVMTLAPWNYPLLTAANSVFPAVLAGNGVLISHGFRTPICAQHFDTAFQHAGAPSNLVSWFCSRHEVTRDVIESGEPDFVSFTGSVEGGRAVYKAVSDTTRKFIDCTLELGGKDGAYVAEDADPKAAAALLVDGAFYNAGQSCCGVERVYVHDSIYEQFLDEATRLVQGYKMGDPMDPDTTLGPIAQPHHVGFLHRQVLDAVKLGARVTTGGNPCTDDAGQGRFFQPTVVADCNHTMQIMREESFGPVIAVQPVSDDKEAIHMLNDSKYGLTAILCTTDKSRAQEIAPQLEAGTVFLNRCDYLHPDLPWQGRKETGKGFTLSKHAFEPFLQFKNYHFRV